MLLLLPAGLPPAPLLGPDVYITDEILEGLAEAGSRKGRWEGKAGKLCRKLRTMQSVVMARTYADKASLHVSELLLCPGNTTDTSASAAPVCFSLESALMNLRAVCYECTYCICYAYR